MTSPCGGLNHKFCPKSKIVWKVWNIHRSDQFLMLIPNISFVLTKNVYFDLLWRIMVLYIVKWQVPGIMLPTETVEIRRFAWAILFNRHFTLYTNIKKSMGPYIKFSTYELVFQRFPIYLISENPLKLMFGTKTYVQSSWLSTGENRSSLSHVVLDLFKRQSHSWIFWTTPTFILKKKFI